MLERPTRNKTEMADGYHRQRQRRVGSSPCSVILILFPKVSLSDGKYSRESPAESPAGGLCRPDSTRSGELRRRAVTKRDRSRKYRLFPPAAHNYRPGGGGRRRSGGLGRQRRAVCAATAGRGESDAQRRLAVFLPPAAARRVCLPADAADL